MNARIYQDLLRTHDLYHLRYGRGAVIVAIAKGSEGSSHPMKTNSDKYVAQLFASRNQDQASEAPNFDPIVEIDEADGVVRVLLQYTHETPPHRSHTARATIERHLPSSQVTIEIVRSNSSERPWLPVASSAGR